MTRWRDDPDGAADQLIVDSLDDLALPPGAAIIAVDAGARLLTALRPHAVVAVTRRLRAGGGVPSADWPETSMSFGGGLLRLPKDKRELTMSAHLITARLAAGASLYVYGGNDEGIRSAAKLLGELGAVDTMTAHSHGRVLRVRIEIPSTRGALDAWRETHPLVIGTARDWVSYPGTFAGGSLDPATALLIDHLPIPLCGSHILDFACGSGVIGAALRARTSDFTLTGIDNDALARRAAAENIPNATWHWGTSLAVAGSARFDMIVSNPPFHEGVRETLSIIDALIADAPHHLTPDGQLWLVTQRRFVLDPLLRKNFTSIAIVADDGRFRVWHGARPLKRQPTRR